MSQPLRSTDARLPSFDPLDPVLRADPYPIYAALRRDAPLSWLGGDDGRGCWVVVRHADCRAVLRDPSMSMTSATELVPPSLRGGAAARVLPNMLTFTDGDRHRRLRGLVARAFTPRTVGRLEERIRIIVDGLLEDLEQCTEVDLMADFAFEVPVLVICEMLGIPTEDRGFFKRWTPDFSRIFESDWLETEQIEACHSATGALIGYLQEHIERLRASPGDAILDHLIAAEDGDDCLSHEELLAISIQLLNAGYETTMSLIGNGVRALLTHPEQWRRLHLEPALRPQAVEECLRWDSPVQYTGRVVKRRTEMHGTTIEEGESILTIVASANRDSELCDDPDRFDIGREPVDHLSFGFGAHFCLGAHLARVEACLAVGGLAERFPRMRLVDEEWRYRDSLLFRTLESLRVEF